ncbi:MAG: orotate phosphoribosyltransferase [Firmicutes bacterium]|nr:orotate phosphoribosyltransferase [Bacillota bacterium]
MYNSEEILAILKAKDALLEGHFRLTSGRHAAYYMQCAKLLQYPDAAGPLCEQLAGQFADEHIDTVVGPATGAIIIAYEVARALKTKALFTERENGVMCLRRGFEIKPGSRVLVVEDVVTTGGSVKEVIEVVRGFGAEVAGVGVLVDRSNGKIDFGVPLKALVSLEIESFPPENCPLCKEGKLELVKPGSRQIKP